jgi:hypothetical protein
MKRGGIIKDPRFNIYADGGDVKPSAYMELMNILNAMSPEEKEQFQFMLNQMKPKKK